MSIAIAVNVRKILFLGGLLAITGSFLFDPFFANDQLPLQTVPEPNILPLLAIGGILGIAVALIRRFRK
ncbi:MAG: PEP-CTERM sorting domain-containing protein [Gammaproteobacteria bacterium]